MWHKIDGKRDARKAVRDGHTVGMCEKTAPDTMTSCEAHICYEEDFDRYVTNFSRWHSGVSYYTYQPE